VRPGRPHHNAFVRRAPDLSGGQIRNPKSEIAQGWAEGWGRNSEFLIPNS